MSVTGKVAPTVLPTRRLPATVAATVVELVASPTKNVTGVPGVKVPSPLWAAVMKSRGEIMAKAKPGLLVSQPTPDKFMPAATNEAEVLASGASVLPLGFAKLVEKRSKRGS